MPLLFGFQRLSFYLLVRLHQAHVHIYDITISSGVRFEIYTVLGHALSHLHRAQQQERKAPGKVPFRELLASAQNKQYSDAYPRKSYGGRLRNGADI